MSNYLALADKSLQALNEKINAAIDDGMIPVGSVNFRYGLYLQAVYRSSSFIPDDSEEYTIVGANTVQGLSAEVEAMSGTGMKPSGGVSVFDGIYLQVMTTVSDVTPSAVRQKSECYFSGLSLVIPTTTTNLINLIKALPHTGSMTPFFNTTTNKFNVFNVNATTTFKLNIVGAWSGGSTNRSMTVSFPNTNGNTMVYSRDASVTTDTLSFPTFFSVDKDGNLATNGSDITIQSNGGTFTATAILILAEQMVPAA